MVKIWHFTSIKPWKITSEELKQKHNDLEEKIKNLHELSLNYKNINMKFAVKLMLLQLKIEYSVEFDKYVSDLVRNFKDNQNSRDLLIFLNDNNIKKELYLKSTENDKIARFLPEL